MSNKTTCRTCSHWGQGMGCQARVQDDDAGASRWGECRRTSPAVFVMADPDLLPQTYWPETMVDGWCGEHQL
jgi:hypothetical protein